jgi:hypothetical protein
MRRAPVAIRVSLYKPRDPDTSNRGAKTKRTYTWRKFTGAKRLTTGATVAPAFRVPSDPPDLAPCEACAPRCRASQPASATPRNRQFSARTPTPCVMLFTSSSASFRTGLSRAMFVLHLYCLLSNRNKQSYIWMHFIRWKRRDRSDAMRKRKCFYPQRAAGCHAVSAVEGSGRAAPLAADRCARP